MQKRVRIHGLLALGLVMALSSSAFAGGLQTQRTRTQRENGTREDITVPYLTSGTSTFMAGSVGPKIYKSPTVDDPSNPQARGVYNLPFYGGTQSFGDASNGANSQPWGMMPDGRRIRGR